MADSEKTHRVVIVGAGFAGFNAARELVQLVASGQAGYDRLILTARRRLRSA
jgi:monoamine oxidase